MTKISQLPPDTTLTLSDVVALISSGGVTSKATLLDLKNILAPQRIRQAQFFMGADNIGGATYPNNQECNEIKFTGTPTNFGRLSLLVPQDYVSGTTATIVLALYSDNANNQSINNYVGCRPVSGGGAFSAWNIQSNINTGTTINASTTPSIFNVLTISASFMAAGNSIAVAFRPSAAITGNIYIVGAYLSYTASA